MWIRVKKNVCWWRGVIFTVPCVTVIWLLVRSWGWLQPAELAALDLAFQLRPPAPPDNRIVIVGVFESDIQKLQQWPTSDRVLAKLLTQIKRQQPSAIGLDIYRDVPIEPGHQELVKVFQTTPNLIGVEKAIGERSSAKIAPPPVLKQLGQIAANDVVVDGDGVVRRAILFPYAEDDPGMPSLGLAAALAYLKRQGIVPQSDPGGWLQLRQTVFFPFEESDGGYVRTDAGSYQILLDYRGAKNSFPIVSVTDVLENRIPPNLLKGRIVLVGAIAPSLNDLFLTPYSRGSDTTPLMTPGVEIQAHLASQILGAVLDDRPLLRVWSDPLEYIWLVLWIALSAIWTYRCRTLKNTIGFLLVVALGTSLLAIALTGIGYLGFSSGWWIPVVPPLLGIFSAAIILTVYNYIEQLQEANIMLSQTVEELEQAVSELQQTKRELEAQLAENATLYQQLAEHNQNLEIKVAERTSELQAKNEQLENALHQLQTAQQQMIAQEKLAALGALTAGIAHEIKNPLNFVNNFAAISARFARELKTEIEAQADNLARDSVDQIEELATDIVDNLSEIVQHGKRADSIIQSMLLHAHQGQGSPQRELTDINALVDEAIKLCYHSLRSRYSDFNIDIETNYDRSLTPISLAPQELSRAAINIITNAMYATYTKAPNAGTQFIPTLTVSTQKLKQAVEIRIRDNGSGIAPEIVEKIFHPFFTTKPPGQGTGLGLSIAHEIIVGQHGGTINIDTVLGEYAEFVITIPQ